MYSRDYIIIFIFHQLDPTTSSLNKQQQKKAIRLKVKVERGKEAKDKHEAL